MLSDEWMWGEIPQGFKKITDETGARLVVRQDQAKWLSLSVCQAQSSMEQSTRLEGRGKLKAVRLQSGEVALIRAYRHGGLLRAATGELFSAWPPRPFRELRITEELRRRGVPTVEVYGACVKIVWGPIYRGWLVTRELAGAEDLWMALRSGLVRELGAEAVLRAIAGSVRMLHREGVYHRDLNLKNLLLRREQNGVVAYIIDFDRAKLLLGELSPELARRNLARLLRSIRKLDPERKVFLTPWWDDFLGYYRHYGEVSAGEA